MGPRASTDSLKTRKIVYPPGNRKTSSVIRSIAESLCRPNCPGLCTNQAKFKFNLEQAMKAQPGE
jgi:hypothetical protein